MEVQAVFKDGLGEFRLEPYTVTHDSPTDDLLIVWDLLISARKQHGNFLDGQGYPVAKISPFPTSRPRPGPVRGTRVFPRPRPRFRGWTLENETRARFTQEYRLVLLRHETGGSTAAMQRDGRNV